MKKFTSSLRGERIFILMLVICCGVFVIATTWSTAKSSQIDNRSKPTSDEISELKKSLKIENIKVTNKVKSINVVSVEKDSGNVSIVLSLKNESDKKITAYMVAAGDSLTFADYAFSEEDGISSRELLKVHQEIGTASFEGGPYQISPDLRKKGIVVLAVIFEDGTTEGEPNAVENLIQYRLGGKAQIERTLSELNKIKELSEDRQLAEFDRFKSNIQASSTQQEITPSYFRFGAKDVQDTFLMEMENFKNNADKESKYKVNKLIERYRKIISRCIL